MVVRWPLCGSLGNCSSRGETKRKRDWLRRIGGYRLLCPSCEDYTCAWHAEIFLEDGSGRRTSEGSAEFDDEQTIREWSRAALESLRWCDRPLGRDEAFCYVCELHGPDGRLERVYLFDRWEQLCELPAAGPAR